MTSLVCWTVTEGAGGMESQAQGLAEAVLLRLPGRLVTQHVRLAWPWRTLPARLAPRTLARAAESNHGLRPPWPDLVVSCGRQGAVVAAAIRRQSGGHTLAVHIQDPKLPLNRFDLVAAPVHDWVRGPNVITTRTAVHRLTRAVLDQAAANAPAEIRSLPRPLVAILLGGPNRYYRFNDAAVANLARVLKPLASGGTSLAITPSRRTPAGAAQAIKQEMGVGPVYVWDGTLLNPYSAIMGLADAVLVTLDSVSMISEATASGRPVYLLDLPRRRNDRRFRAFHQSIIDSGMARPWQGCLEPWSYTPPDETSRVADAVVKMIHQRQKEAPAP